MVQIYAEGGKRMMKEATVNDPLDTNGKGYWVGFQSPALDLAPPPPVGSVTLNKSLDLKKLLLHLKIREVIPTRSP